MTAHIRRGTLLSFASATWTAMVYLDGAESETQIPVGQWVPSGMMLVDSEVAVLIFDNTNTDDGLVLGPYGVVSLWDYPALSGLTTGQVLRATSALAAAFGALDLANANAVTGALPYANIGGTSGTWTPVWSGSTGAGTFTYTNQVGYWYRIGDVVNLWARLSISAISLAPTGNMRITGLPFTSGTKVPSGIAFWLISQLKFTAASLALTGSISNSSTLIALQEVFTNAAAVAYPAANFTNAACDVGFTGSFLL